eukprot:14847367-Alexandrium_andersonii.AAC.1
MAASSAWAAGRPSACARSSPARMPGSSSRMGCDATSRAACRPKGPLGTFVAGGWLQAGACSGCAPTTLPTLPSRFSWLPPGFPS